MVWSHKNFPALNMCVVPRGSLRREISWRIFRSERSVFFATFICAKPMLRTEGVQLHQKCAWSAQHGCRSAQVNKGRRRSRYEIHTRAKEMAPRSTLLASPEYKNLCTNIFRSTSLDSKQLCARAEAQPEALRRYDERPCHCFQQSPEQQPQREPRMRARRLQ